MTSDNHVPAEALAAWAEGRLGAAEAATVETHLSSCDSCQEVLAVFARTDLQNVESGFRRTASVSSGFNWFRWRWAVPVAAAATAAAIWVAVPNDPNQDEFERTVAPAIQERTAAPPPAPAASADSTAPAPTGQATSPSSRRDAANFGFEDRAEKRAAEGAVRDQEVKSEAPQAAAAARAPEAPPAPEQDRLRAEAVTGLQRQAVSEAISPDPLVRWRIVPPGRLERSTDGAQTWQPVTLPQPVDLVAVQATSATIAVVTAADGRQFRTDDQGKTWTLQP